MLICRKPVQLSDEVYWWLCKRKVELKVKSLDDVLRFELPGFQHDTGLAASLPTEEGVLNEYGNT